MKKNDEECVLCAGSGIGRYRGICTRCGGYGTIPKSCSNPPKSTKEEIERERT